MRRASRLVLPLLLATLTSACSRPDAGDVPEPGVSPDAATTEEPSDLTARAAGAICGALFRCCDADLDDYFAPYREHELLKAFKARLPPAAGLDEQGCRGVLTEMLDVVPLGDWVRAGQADMVAIDGPAFDACVATLATASCGEPVRDALWDSTCLGFAPPGGGDEQRSFVRRSGKAGDACSPIRDGLGGAFYGTCDPREAFCCFEEPGQIGCQLPYANGGSPRPGTCTAVAADGAACSVALPLTLCATGSECSADTATCVPPSTTSLVLGATCVDGSWHLLGDCQNAWCDVLGSKKCERLRDDAESCEAPDQCRSGRCDAVCKPLELCDGAAPPGDAGVPGSAQDAPPSAAGETCTGAPVLAASSTSPLTGYTSRITGALGASNDYNPLDTSGLPPACSIVYDARGHEVVFALTLAPGERLRVRGELADGKQPALYLLDACPGATWPDFDGSTRCGSNEYNVGFCGIGGCDPAVLDVRYPASAQAPRTFYLVIDEVGGATASGFVIDWSVSSS